MIRIVPDFCARVRRETTLKEEVRITDVIDFLESRGNAFQAIRAIATARFYRDGLTAARAYLDGKEWTFATYPEAVRTLLGGSWPVWRQQVLDSLDHAEIDAVRAAVLARYAKRGLRDEGICRC